MTTYKVTIIIKNAVSLFEYEKQDDKKDFFEDLNKEILNSKFSTSSKYERDSAIKATFYISSEEEDIRDYISEIINTMIRKNAVTITISEVQDEEKMEIEESKNKDDNKPAAISTSQDKEEVEIVESKNEDDDKPLTIIDETNKISNLKAGLLKKIRGQDFAINVVSEAIFEADMFAKDNPERKGPLLSFLFLGPSGVGKTYLSNVLGELLDKKVLTVDMSSLSNEKAKIDEFNKIGRFCRQNKGGIIIFDEFEKAAPEIIPIFLQILDEARYEDTSFKDNILILTTNAGKSLYQDSTARILSNTPKKVILDALNKDKHELYKTPSFPTGITTRFANGHIVLFNHLEPYALMEIIKDEINLQTSIFSQKTGIEIEVDERVASTILYSSGGVADARTLRGEAKNVIVKEIYDALIAAKTECANIKSIHINVETEEADKSITSLYSIEQPTLSLVFSSEIESETISKLSNNKNLTFLNTSDLSVFKKSLRGIVDYVIIDPFCGCKDMEKIPVNIEDWKSDGLELIFYMFEHYSEIPVYILNSNGRDIDDFSTLISKGAKGIIEYSNDKEDSFIHEIKELTASSIINNSAFSLTRSAKAINYNCAQYIKEDNLVISFEKLELKQVPYSGDAGLLFSGDTDNGETFKDVIGCKAAKEAMQDIADCIKNPREYALSGKKTPKGILLYGKPGTGKTMLARAFANEVGAAFLPTSATAFFNKYVGQTEENIRNLFATAKKYAPAIIFIDEVDAIAKKRSEDSNSKFSNDALAQFLSEMDGFSNDEKRPVFILAATNFSIDGSDGPALDPAFVRRFDKHVYFDYPNKEDRCELFKVLLDKHCINFGAEHDTVLNNLATRSAGMSNADIVSILNNFIRSSVDKTSSISLMDALDNFLYGEIKDTDPSEILQTAYHEAGHALIYKLLTRTPAYLTIVSRGNFGGFMQRDEHERTTFTYSELLNSICTALAGRAAETLVYGEESGNNTGASSDIEHARNYLKAALNTYAMGDKLFERTTPKECEEIMQKQYAKVTELLNAHRSTLDALANLLAKEKSIDQVGLDEFFNENL